MFEFPILIGDIGGTNARFCILDEPGTGAGDIKSVKVADFADLESALVSSFSPAKLQAVVSMICAVAGPKSGSGFKLTNADWAVNSDIKVSLGLSRLMLMNDFSAQALAALALGSNDRSKLTPISANQEKPKLIIGPGTGLGVASLICVDEKQVIIPGEGGHIDIGPRTDREWEIWKHLRRYDGRVSAEGVLSGSGLENLYQAIVKANGSKGGELEARAITKSAEQGADAIAQETVDLFITLLGRIAGDLALVSLAQGGVYLAGGIALKIPYLKLCEQFLPAFLDKAPNSYIMKSIPVYLLNHPNAAMEGLAFFANSLGSVTIQSAVDVD